MYSIAYVVFGYQIHNSDELLGLPYGHPLADQSPLREAHDELLERFADDEFVDLIDEDVVSTRYSGDGERPLYVGVEVGSFSPGATIGEIQRLLAPRNISDLIWQTAQKKIQLPEDLRLHLDRLHPDGPQLFVTWATS